MKLSDFSHNCFFCLLLIPVILTSCVSGKNEGRPSPYGSDSAKINAAELSIAYSSPGVKKRKVWDELVPYGNMWRTGANEATVFNTTDDILVAGKLLPKGKYAVFSIPDSREWTIVFNEDWNQWGAYNYDEAKDALRLNVVPKKIDDFQERMVFRFKNQKLIFHWEYLTFELDISTP